MARLKLLGSIFILLFVSASVSAQSRLTRFPLAGFNPYTAPITAVLDHSSSDGAGSGFYCRQPDRKVVAYTGEIGTIASGDPLFSCQLRAYRNIAGVPFVLNGNHVGNQSELHYDGHPGYDYDCAEGDPILAAAAGTVLEVNSDPLGLAPADTNPFRIVHGDIETWYLHTSGLIPSSGHHVAAGEQVATCSDAGVPGSTHLHFEVRTREGYKILDPYGWEGSGHDPLPLNPQGGVLDVGPLWSGFAQPRVDAVELVPNGADYSATIEGGGFLPGATVTLWDRLGSHLLSRFDPCGGCVTATSIQVELNTAGRSLEEVLLKVDNPNGPRSAAVGLATPGPATTEAAPLELIGITAPGGGVFSHFARYLALENDGTLWFRAAIDLNSDGIQDEVRTYKRDASGIQRVSLSGVGFVDELAVGSAGDIVAIGGMPLGIFLLRSGSSGAATEIARVDQPVPVPELAGHVFSSFAFFALDSAANVWFTAETREGNAGFCCDLFRYEADTGILHRVLADGELLPGLGLLELGQPRMTVTSDGDALFPAIVGGVHGIYRATTQGAVSAVMISGDSIPPFGATVDRVWMGRAAGRRLATVARLEGGNTSQAIFLIDDVRLPTQPRVIAFDGQATQTEVGGIFARVDSIRPFEINNDYPEARADGAVVFLSRLVGATVDGVPTSEGIFMWNGREFEKLAVNGDRLGDGRIQQGVSAHVLNDTGQVSYFVARFEEP